MDFMDLAVSEWKAFDTQFALDSFGRYWLENERLILQAAEINEAQHGPKWKPQTQDEYAESAIQTLGKGKAEIRGRRLMRVGLDCRC